MIHDRVNANYLTAFFLIIFFHMRNKWEGTHTRTAIGMQERKFGGGSFLVLPESLTFFQKKKSDYKFPF